MTTLTSKTIDALRWPLAALVIICHAQFVGGFAAHIVFLRPLMEALYGLMRPATQCANILFYSGFHIFYIALLTALYFALARLIPRTMSVLTGGRGQAKEPPATAATKTASSASTGT